MDVVVPSERDFMKDRSISDLVYVGILVYGEKYYMETSMETKIRIKVKKEILYKELRRITNRQKRTIEKKAKTLVELGFAVDLGDEIYADFYNHYVRLDVNVLNELLQTGMRNIIKVYIRLYIDFINKKQKGEPSFWYIKSIMDSVDFRYNSRNIKRFVKIIWTLKRFGLIDFKKENGEIFGYSGTCYVTTAVSKDIPLIKSNRFDEYVEKFLNENEIKKYYGQYCQRDVLYALGYKSGYSNLTKKISKENRFKIRVGSKAVMVLSREGVKEFFLLNDKLMEGFREQKNDC